VHPPQLHGLSFPWEVGGASLRGNPPQAVTETKPNPPVGALCYSDAEQAYVWAGVVWDGCQPQPHAFPGQTDPPKTSVQFRRGGIKFFAAGQMPALFNAADDEVTSLFQGTLERGRTDLFQSSDILAYLF